MLEFHKLKEDAVKLYLEGLGFRAIARFLGVSNVSVLNWVRATGSKIEELESASEITTIEIDEMHSHIGTKKTIVGSGLPLTARDTNSSIVN